MTSAQEADRDFPFSARDVRAVSERLGEPPELMRRRLQAWESYKSLPMPTPRDEAWRRTDIRNLPLRAVGIQAAAKVNPRGNFLGKLSRDGAAPRLVLWPGHAPQLTGNGHLVEQGIVFCDWATAVRQHSELLEKHLSATVRAGEGKFAALAASMAEHGLFVYVPKGLTLQSPLVALLWAPGSGAAIFSRLLVVLDEGASLTLISETASPTERTGEAMHDGIVDLLVGKGARLTMVQVQNWGQHVWNFEQARARVERDGELNWVFADIGSRLSKSFGTLDLQGEGAHGVMSGFYFARGNQHLDRATLQDHLAPNTTSDLLFSGALLDRSRSVWRGMIHVAPGAMKADGYQVNRNLILSKQARADSLPGLEILADDVRCSHAATVGRLEGEPLYYLMSRGLSREQAVRLLVEGFFATVLGRVPVEMVHRRLKRMIGKRLSHVTSLAPGSIMGEGEG